MEDERTSKKTHPAEEAVAKLRQVGVLTAQGWILAEAIGSIGMTEATHYDWRGSDAAARAVQRHVRGGVCHSGRHFREGEGIGSRPCTSRGHGSPR